MPNLISTRRETTDDERRARPRAAIARDARPAAHGLHPRGCGGQPAGVRAAQGGSQGSITEQYIHAVQGLWRAQQPEAKSECSAPVARPVARKRAAAPRATKRPAFAGLLQ